MALPKLRITVEIEIWPGEDDEDLRKLQAELENPEISYALQPYLEDAAHAVHDWKNYGTPKFELIQT